MIATIVSCFNNYDIRLRYVEDVLSELGYSVIFICSDFDHGAKSSYVIDKENAIQIHVKQYEKNLSIDRIKSHLQFSKKVYFKLKEINPDLIYAIIPPNSLVKKLSLYRKKNKKTKLIYDIFDLWPESLPVSGTVKKLLFCWKNLRDKHLRIADKVFTECDYYKRFLPKSNSYKTAYLCKPERNLKFNHDNEHINFIYLGSINSLIDIKAIINFLICVKNVKPVSLSIIGNGERVEEFKALLSAAEITFRDFGAIYDESEKDKVISECHFGINMYRAGLCIGLTMKSLEYFSRGLPIINCNIADTYDIVEKYGCGFNISVDKDVKDMFKDFNEEKWLKMHSNTKKAYAENFSVGIYNEILKNNLQ